MATTQETHAVHVPLLEPLNELAKIRVIRVKSSSEDAPEMCGSQKRALSLQYLSLLTVQGLRRGAYTPLERLYLLEEQRSYLPVPVKSDCRSSSPVVRQD